MKIISVAYAAALLSSSCLVALSSHTEVEPMSKALDMLNDLKLKITNEEKEAYILYSEYNSQCAKDLKATSWLVQTDNELINELTAETDSEMAIIMEKAAKIEETVTLIANTNKQLKDATNVRASEKEVYEKQHKELAEMIRALRDAIAILDSKKGASLVQLPRTATIAQALQAMVHASAISSADAQRMAAYVQMTSQSKDEDANSEDSVGAPSAVYQKQSGDIVEILQDTLDKAEEQRKSAEMAQIKSDTHFKKISITLEGTLSSAQKDLMDIRGEKSEVEEAKATDEGELAQARQKLTVDEKTFKLTTAECKENSLAFKTESKEREDEITAVLKAIKAIEQATGLKRSGAMLQLSTAEPSSPAMLQQSSGCASSQYGCCSDGKTAKDDEAGINCGLDSYKQVKSEVNTMVTAFHEMSFLQEKSQLQEGSTLQEGSHLEEGSRSKQTSHSKQTSNSKQTSLFRQTSHSKQKISSKQKSHSKLDSGTLDQLHQAVHYVRDLADKLNSTSLSQLAMHIAQVGTYAPVSDLNSEFSQNPFKKVKTLIENMIAKLEDEADAEKGEHEYCDEQMAKAATDIKDKKVARDEADTRYSAALAALAKLNREIVEIGKSLKLSYNQSAYEVKFMSSLKEFYEKEKKENEAAKMGVEAALKALREYYVEDAATTDTDVSTSIISLLEIILEDITKTLLSLDADFEDEEKAHEKASTQHMLDQQTYEEDGKHRKSRVASAEKKVADTKEDFDAAQAELDEVYKVWNVLKERCTFKKDGFKERIDKMEKEKKGLEEALAILNGPSTAALLQTGSRRSLRGLPRLRG